MRIKRIPEKRQPENLNQREKVLNAGPWGQLWPAQPHTGAQDMVGRWGGCIPRARPAVGAVGGSVPRSCTSPRHRIWGETAVPAPPPRPQHPLPPGMCPSNTSPRGWAPAGVQPSAPTQCPAHGAGGSRTPVGSAPIAPALASPDPNPGPRTRLPVGPRASIRMITRCAGRQRSPVVRLQAGERGVLAVSKGNNNNK